MPGYYDLAVADGDSGTYGWTKTPSTWSYGKIVQWANYPTAYTRSENNESTNRLLVPLDPTLVLDYLHASPPQTLPESAHSCDILSVSVYAYISNTDWDTAKVGLGVSGTWYWSGYKSAGAWHWVYQNWAVNPKTGLTWQWSDFNNIDLGLSYYDVTCWCDVMMLRVYVANCPTTTSTSSSTSTSTTQSTSTSTSTSTTQTTTTSTSTSSTTSTSTSTSVSTATTSTLTTTVAILEGFGLWRTKDHISLPDNVVMIGVP